MKQILRYSLVALLAMIGMNVSAQEFTFDFSDETNPWNFPTEQLKETGTFTKDGKSITITTTNYTRWFSDTKVLLFGKKDATITLPAFDFDVERIDIVGASGASGKVTFNIFVGDEAVSTEVTGAKSTAIFNIAEGKQAAGTVYVIKNTNDNNNQIAKILIWKKGTSGSGEPEPEVHIANTAETAYTVAKAFELIDAGKALSETVYVKGIVSQVDKFDDRYNSITYWISDDGTTTQQLQVYSGKGLDGANFTSIDDVKVGANVIIKGNIKKYNTTYEFDKNNQLVSYNYSSSEGGVIYSWEGGAEGATEVGGKATYMSGPEGTDRVNYKNADYYTLSINGKKANMGSEVSNNGGYIQIDLEKELKADDAIELTGYINKNESGKEASIFFQFEKGDGVDDEYVYGDADNIDATVGGKISTHVFKVPAAAEGSKNFKMSRNKAGTNVFLTKLVITRGGSTGISDVKVVKVFDNVIYNLAGQKVGKDYKGIVIMNGRKYMNK